MNSIEVRGATKSYDSKNPVLNGLDLTVQTGSMYVSKFFFLQNAYFWIF